MLTWLYTSRAWCIYIYISADPLGSTAVRDLSSTPPVVLPWRPENPESDPPQGNLAHHGYFRLFAVSCGTGADAKTRGSKESAKG